MGFDSIFNYCLGIPFLTVLETSKFTFDELLHEIYLILGIQLWPGRKMGERLCFCPSLFDGRARLPNFPGKLLIENAFPGKYRWLMTTAWKKPLSSSQWLGVNSVPPTLTKFEKDSQLLKYLPLWCWVLACGSTTTYVMNGTRPVVETTAHSISKDAWLSSTSMNAVSADVPMTVLVGICMHSCPCEVDSFSFTERVVSLTTYYKPRNVSARSWIILTSKVCLHS